MPGSNFFILSMLYELIHAKVVEAAAQSTTWSLTDVPEGQLPFNFGDLYGFQQTSALHTICIGSFMLVFLYYKG